MPPSEKVPLSPAEFDSLREVSKRVLQRIIPIEHEKRLIQLGVIEQKLGGLVLTPAGELRLAMGR